MRCFDRDGEFAREIDHNIALARQKLRCATQPALRREPRRNRARVCRCPHRVLYLCQENAATTAGQLEWPRNAYHVNSAPSRPRVNRSGRLAECDLSPAGGRCHGASRLLDGDVSSRGLQLRHSRDASHPDVAAAGFQHRAPSDLAGGNVSAAGRCVGVPADVLHPDMASPRFHPRRWCRRASPASARRFGRIHASRADVPPSGHQPDTTLDVLGINVSGVRFHVEGVAERHAHLILYPKTSTELVPRHPACNLYSGRSTSSGQCEPVEQLPGVGLARIGFDAH